MKHQVLWSIFYLLFAGSNAAQTNPFEKEILAFEAKDAANPPIEGQILLYGSSTLRLWSTCETDFANGKYKVVNRGFGGSQTSDANMFFDRVVMPHIKLNVIGFRKLFWF